LWGVTPFGILCEFFNPFLHPLMVILHFADLGHSVFWGDGRLGEGGGHFGSADFGGFFVFLGLGAAGGA
jgi:hypothetical protein